MRSQTIIILVIVGIAIFVWLPAIVISVRRALREDKDDQNKTKNSHEN